MENWFLEKMKTVDRSTKLIKGQKLIKLETERAILF